jgi:hypothetical protein
MRLSAEGYRERKWGPFPALRQALEDKQIPSNYFGPTSVADNMSEALFKYDSYQKVREWTLIILAYQYGPKSSPLCCPPSCG